MSPGSNGYLVSDDFNIFVISDGTGKTAHTVVEAALAQFELPRVNVLRFTHVKNKEEIYSIFDMVRHQKDIVVYTIVNEDFAQTIMAEALSHNILAIDLLGPIVNVLKKISSRKPRGEPGLLRRMEGEAISRVEAVEYAMEKSTGFNLKSLGEADVILLTMWYPHRDEFIFSLAEKGIKCCFLMLDPDMPLPLNLEEAVGKNTGKTIIGLSMEPEYLSALRKERINALGLYQMNPRSDIDIVKREIDFIQQIYERLSCAVIDITNLSSKDVVKLIVNHIKNEREVAE